ncbi:tetratricopeptide repeat protein [Dictyobacter arantiisoli]|uniref:TIR domain-containing protein n=1 Tax=Dictyobacter arantiisoli TaxID=2014874 RepID=A0A5A5TGD3_9CHLR|nr:tetratricopeptide repeat protein [Dictyobacter arantiisoli]GCF10216.1 hypothetical protein KDI_37800 [Dictyobacter arantiisoli]
MAIHSNSTGPLPFQASTTSEEISNETMDTFSRLPDPVEPIKIAILFCDDDSTLNQQLKKYLNPLIKNKYAHIYQELSAGSLVIENILSQMDNADVIIILLSVNFDCDPVWNDSKIHRHIKKCAENGKRIWPIATNFYGYEMSDICKDYNIFFSAETDKKVAANQDEMYLKIFRKIAHEIEYMLLDRYSQIGDVYVKQLQFSQALNIYNYKFVYVQEYAPILLRKGRIFRQQGKFEEAKDCFKAINSYSSIIQTLAKSQGRKIPALTPISSELIMVMNDYSYGCALMELGGLVEISQIESWQTYFTKTTQIFQQVYQYCAILLEQKTLPIKKNLQEVCAMAYCSEGDVYTLLGHRNHHVDYYNHAYNLYVSAHTMQSDTPLYLLNMGKTCVTLGNLCQDEQWYTQALIHYTDATVKSGENAPAYMGCGDVLFHLQRYDEALTAYNEALHCNPPQQAPLFAKMGHIFLTQKKAQEALLSFETALQLEAENAQYHAGKGQALAMLNRYKDALQAYDLALNYGNSSLDLIARRVSVLVEIVEEEYAYGHSAEGFTAFKEALNICQRLLTQVNKEQQADIFCNIGRIYFAQNKIIPSLIYYADAIDTTGHKASNYLGAAKIYTEMGDQANADKYFRSTYQLLADAESKIKADYYKAFGRYHERFAGQTKSEAYVRSWEGACTYYEKAIALYTHAFRRAITHVNLGEAYREINRYEEAIDAFSNALEEDSELIACYFLQGECYAYLKQYTKACELFSKAIEVGYDIIFVRIAWGNALLKRGRYLEAKEKFEGVITKAKQNISTDVAENKHKTEIAYAYGGIGIALYYLDDEEDAIQAFVKANNFDPYIFKYQYYARPLDSIMTSIEVRIRNNPSDWVAYRQKGDILTVLKQYEEAFNMYTKAMQSGRLLDAQLADVIHKRDSVSKQYAEYQNTNKLNNNSETLVTQKQRNDITSTSHHQQPKWLGKLFNRQRIK